MGLIVALIYSVLWADVCPGGQFWIEEHSADPQVLFTVQNVSQTYVKPDDDTPGHTECENYEDTAQEVYAVSYTTKGAVKEVRLLAIGDGLNEQGTVCTAPGIYLFKLISPILHSGYEGFRSSNCDYTFVSHSEECPSWGVPVVAGSSDYEDAVTASACNGSLEETIAESLDGPVPDNSVHDDPTAVSDRDNTATDGSTEKAGCALILID